MIARAERKARRRGSPAGFAVAAAQSLPFPDAHFDVVLSTLMLHHLPRASRVQLAHEVRRVLKPGGRLVAIDFGEGGRGRRGVARHLPWSHGHTRPDDMAAPFREAGLTVVDAGLLGAKGLHYLRAVSGEGTGGASAFPAVPMAADGRHRPRALLIALAAGSLLLVHVGAVGLVLAGAGWATSREGLLALAGAALAAVAAKAGIIAWHHRGRRRPR